MMLEMENYMGLVVSASTRLVSLTMIREEVTE